MVTNEELKQIVVKRLEVLPANKKISVGSSGDFSRDELIEHVKRGDGVGMKIVQIELEFLQALKEGVF